MGAGLLLVGRGKARSRNSRGALKKSGLIAQGKGRTQLEAKAPEEGSRLETLSIVFTPVPDGSQRTVNEAIISSYAHIAGHKPVY